MGTILLLTTEANDPKTDDVVYKDVRIHVTTPYGIPTRLA